MMRWPWTCIQSFLHRSAEEPTRDPVDARDDEERESVPDEDEGAAVPDTVEEEPTDVEGYESVALDEEFYGCFIDNRDKSPKSKRKRFAHKPEKVYGVVLHQMAVNRPDSSKRFHLVTCHFVVTLGGQIHWNHPFDAYLYAANGFNKFTLSIELAGNFEGIHGSGQWYKPEKFGRNVATPIQLHRTRQLMKWLKEVSGPVANMDLTHVFAHRQSTRKPGDPGSRVWIECGIWGQEVLGLSDGGVGYKIGKGKAIDETWDDRDRSGETKDA